MNDLTRRLFLKALAGWSLLSVCPFTLRGARAQVPSLPANEPSKSIGQFFKGEELVYEIGFWLVRRGALGRLSFKETDKKGLYLATLQTETLGILGWVARYRVDTYRATMEEIDGGKSLRAISFEEDVKLGSKINRRVHLFDYERRKWINKKRNKDGTWQVRETEIPPGKVYDDFITASYNFRYGVYGNVERGKKYVVATFPRKGASSYEVKVAPQEEEEKKRKSEKGKTGKDFLVQLKLPPEITYSKEGIVEGWLSKDLFPIEGAIRDVILVGDVKGTLIQRTKAQG